MHSSPCRTIRNFQKEVAREARVNLDRGVAHQFFHRRLKLALQKQNQHRMRRKRKQKHILHVGMVPHVEQEKQLMWKNDTWLWKHALLQTTAIRRHETTMQRRLQAYQGKDDEVASSDSGDLYG
jgi:hypothetical protein